VAGVSVVTENPSLQVKTELVSAGPEPVVAHQNSAARQPGVTPEIVAVIEAAAAEFVGSKVCILSIKLLGNADGDSNVWASQGRDIIQTSHNLVQRGH
jgi:hypothetical protein